MYDEEQPRVSAKQRKILFAETLKHMQAEDSSLQPITNVKSRGQLVDSYWGQAWCYHVQSYADHEYAVSLGRSDLRHGCVMDLRIKEQKILAQVMCQELFQVQVSFEALDENIVCELQQRFQEESLTVFDVLSGDFSTIIRDFLKEDSGLFPNLQDLHVSCNCLDDANLCRHVAAVLYGIGIRFDEDPAMFFELRGVQPADLVEKAVAHTLQSETQIESSHAESLFGIDLL